MLRLGFLEMRAVGRSFLLLPVLAAGCGVSTPTTTTEVASTREAVVGGYVDDTTTGVVNMAIDFGGHPYVALCSGSLIAPNLVMTAHHCVSLIAGAPNDQVQCGVSTFEGVGQGSYFLISPATIRPSSPSDPRYFRGSDVRVVPGGQTDVCGHDLALIILRDAIPARLARPIVPRIDSTPDPSETFSADGFGLTVPNSQDSGGTRMRADDYTVQCTGVGCPISTGARDGEWVSYDARICPGDSGGPALDSQGRVMGVASRGGPNCSNAIYTDVASWSDFIIQTARDAASLGGYAPPFWTNGSSVAPPVRPDAGTPSSGTSCQSTSDCASGLLCYAATGNPPGICAERCGASSPDCPTGYACSAVGVCLKARAPAPVAQDSGGCAVGRNPSRGGAPNGIVATLGALLFGCVRRRRQS